MTEITILTAVLFGFLLGVRHALDADHIVAVSTIISRDRSLFRSALVGLSWGIGHTITLFAAGFAVLVFKLAIPGRFALSMEFAVGAILVIMGVPLIRQMVVNSFHIHWHQHDDKKHLHLHSHGETLVHDHGHIRRPLLIGMVHGLAGSGVLIPLVMGTMSSVVQGLFFLLLFGAGSILSMVLFGGLISLPFRFASGFSFRIGLLVQGIAGIISTVFGLFIMWQVGFAGGLFFPAAG